MGRLLGAGRSSSWPAVRRAHIEDHPGCAVCGGSKNLEVHHVRPFNMHPELELSPGNLISLCESKKNGVTCHLFFGHLGNYRSWNKNVVEDTVAWHSKIALRPKN